MRAVQDYEPFGSLLPGRNYSSSSYNFGFNGMRKDDEIHGATGTSYDFGARLYDPRVGRWLSMDPLARDYPGFTPYSYAASSPIAFKDPDGKKIVIFYDSGERNEDGTKRWSMYEYGSKLDLPNDQFVRETVAALDLLASVRDIQMPNNEPSPGGIISDFKDDDEYAVVIMPTADLISSAGLAIETLGRVEFNPTLGFVPLDMQDDGTGKPTGFMPAFVVLHHELRHMWHGQCQDYKDYQSSRGRLVPLEIGGDDNNNLRTFPNMEEHRTSMADTPLMQYFGLGKRLSYASSLEHVSSSTSMSPSSGISTSDVTGGAREVQVDYSQSVFSQ